MFKVFHHCAIEITRKSFLLFFILTCMVPGRTLQVNDNDSGKRQVIM